MKTKKFKISEILTWQPQKEIDPLKIKDLTIPNGEVYPFYGQATLNKGIISYESLIDKVLNNSKGKPTILIHSNNQNIVYVDTPFYLKDGHGATSILQADFLNEKNAMYIIACIKKVIQVKFEYNEKATKVALKNTYIELPIKSDETIDIQYMENYVSSIEKKEKERLRNIIIKECHDSIELNDSELHALKSFDNKHVKLKKFKAGDLFLVSSNPQLNKDSFNFSPTGRYPYFTRTILNNGILGYVDYLDEEHKISGNSIAIGMLGMRFFYMRKDFYAGQFTKTIFPRFDTFDENIALYFISIFNKNSPIYSGELVRNFEKTFNNTIIQVPVQNNVIDFDFINYYISALKKRTLYNLKKEL